MRYNRCVKCGNIINKSAIYDPYLCRKCSMEIKSVKERYGYLDL